MLLVLPLVAVWAIDGGHRGSGIPHALRGAPPRTPYGARPRPARVVRPRPARGVRPPRVLCDALRRAPRTAHATPSTRKAALVFHEVRVAGGWGHQIGLFRAFGARGRGCGWISRFRGSPRRRFPWSTLGDNFRFHPQPPPSARGGPESALPRPRPPASPPSPPTRCGLRVDGARCRKLRRGLPPSPGTYLVTVW